MIEFTLRAVCPKCENVAFTWRLWAARPVVARSSPLYDDTALVPQEHIRLTCDRCGFAVAMKPRDAA